MKTVSGDRFVAVAIVFKACVHSRSTVGEFRGVERGAERERERSELRLGSDLKYRVPNALEQKVAGLVPSGDGEQAKARGERGSPTQHCSHISAAAAYSPMNR